MSGGAQGNVGANVVSVHACWAGGVSSTFGFLFAVLLCVRRATSVFVEHCALFRCCIVGVARWCHSWKWVYP